MSVLPVGISGEEPTGYQIERSLRFNSADSAYLNRTPASSGNRDAWTLSWWVKRSALGANTTMFGTSYTSTSEFYIRFDSGNALEVTQYSSGGVTIITKLITTQVFRDVSAWYHLVFVYDSAQGNGPDRAKLYVNGIQITALSTAIYPTQNTDSIWNASTHTHYIGRYSTAQYFNGYLTEINFIDGSTPSTTTRVVGGVTQTVLTELGEFNSTTGVWQPKAYTGSYGTQGWYLPFSDNTSTTTLGYDAAGSNDWTLNNFSVTAGVGNDSLVDSPTRYGTDTGIGGEVRGNYATLNALRYGSGSTPTLSDGNLKWANSANAGSVIGTIAIPSKGKWYWEAVVPTQTNNFMMVGVIKNQELLANLNSAVGILSTGYGVYTFNGQKYNNSSAATYMAAVSQNTVVTIAFDADTGSLYVGAGGSWANGSGATNQTWANAVAAYTGLTGTIHPAISFDSGNCFINFGQRPFAYTAPSGFKALVTTNLLAADPPTIADGGEYFNVIEYDGNGSTNARTGVGFQPDFVWIKETNAAADHALYDAVRGVQQQLESNTTTDETTEANGLTAFGADGFTVGSLAQVNTNLDTYVAWCWKEGATPGFDIVTYTGNGTARTISHNLGAVPNLIIVKARTTASTDQGWPVYHSANTAAPETDYLLLNTTAATADLDTVWNDAAPTLSVFSVGTNALVNANNDTYVALLFSAIPGFSSMGSYVGNGSVNGPFVFVNHRPAFLLIKRTDTTSNWTILDFVREGYNVDNDPLFPNLSNAEGTTDLADLLSNGFKLRSTDASVNASGGAYIYAAFAENPFAYSLAR